MILDVTLAFATVAWTEHERLVGIAADTRISSNGRVLTDAGVKTYELGGRCAMAASGHAIPPMMAAELTRSLVENHNRRTAARQMSYFDTVRLVGFLLKRSADQQGAVAQALVAGFFNDGAPSVARVVISPDHSRAVFFKAQRGQTIFQSIGDPQGTRLLDGSVIQARREQRPVVASATGILWYIAKLEGAFNSIGGGISVGTCSSADANFSWPVIEIEGRRFLRGMDVTASYRANWPPPAAVIPYDEDWCMAQDRRVASMLNPETPCDVARKPFLDIDAIAAHPETLFASHDDPDL